MTRGLKKLIHRLIASILYRRSTVIIHIGKTGGGTVRALLKRYGFVDAFSFVHTVKPWYHPNKRYIITLRDPLERAISSYQWRVVKLVQQGVQRSRFKNEYQTLLKYKDFNALLENLYKNGEIDRAIERDLLSVHHIRKNIDYYLTDFLTIAAKSAIHAVIRQETLDADIERVFGLRNSAIKRHDSGTAQTSRTLSKTSEENLRRFLQPDYQAIKTLEDILSGNEYPPPQ